LERWADKRAEQADVSGLRILLELAADTLGLGAPGELTPEALDRLLLEEFPNAVVADAEDVPSVLAAARTLVDFLAETGAVSADGTVRLRAELTRIEPDFVAAVAEAASADEVSVAEALAQLMYGDGVDLSDGAAVERWSEQFDALPEEERAVRVS